jgi:hypothetical protein
MNVKFARAVVAWGPKFLRAQALAQSGDIHWYFGRD